MTEFKSRHLQGATLLLIAAAVTVVLWLPKYDRGDRATGRRRSIGVVIDDGSRTPDREVTYRFLCRDKVGIFDECLTLGRFVGCDRDKRAVWEFTDIEQWYRAAPDIFARERGWSAERQPGWKFSRWLCPDEAAGWDSDDLFWAIQALRLFDQEICSGQMAMLEATGQRIRIYVTRGPSYYDYDADTLYWNPAETELLPTDPQERERIAMMTENRVRYIMFRKAPAGWRLYPRPGRRDIWPDVPGDSAAEAWRNYHGVIEY